MNMKKIVVLSGAGVSAESGIKTFRDSNGLWEDHKVEDVATPEAWHRNPELVLDFYNQRRRQAASVQPNNAHRILAELEAYFDVTIVTQNVDNLHEEAGSSNVVHLHGELFKARSTKNPNLIYPIEGTELKLGDLAEDGSQLRPHIVWFGESVPMLDMAIDIVQKADILVVVGTSLIVYPAAGLIHYVSNTIPIYIVDPVRPEIAHKRNFHFIEEKATVGLTRLKQELIEQYSQGGSSK